ncbi:MAG: M16 family metallopeptidase, partial [Lentisphaeria bacterium]
MEYDFSIGDFNFEQLPNGMKVVVQTIPTAPVVSVHVAIGTGSMHESSLGYGLSHFLEHMIFKGSKNYPGRTDIADCVQQFGGYINAYTTKDHTCFHIDCLSEHWEESVAILADAVRNPLFPEDEFDKEKDVILQEVSMYEDNVNWHLQQTSWKMASNCHPFGVPVIGYRDKISEVNRAMMVDYWQLRYQPYNTTLVIVGDINFDEVMTSLNKIFGDWENWDIKPLFIPSYNRRECSDQHDIFFDDNQARIMLTYNLQNGLEEDMATLEVIETILAGSQSSLFVRDLKQREQIALSVGAMSYALSVAGIFSCHASAEPDNLPQLEKRMFEIIDDLCAGRIEQGEIDRAVLRSRLSFLKQLQTASSRAQLLVSAIIDFGSPNYWGPYLKRLVQVDVEEIKRVANKYFSRDRVVVVRQWPEEWHSRINSQKSQISADVRNKHFHLELLPVSKIRFVAYEQPSNPLLYLSIIFPDGSFVDPIGKSGAYSLLSRLLACGSNSSCEEEVAKLLDDNGISLFFSSGNNTFRCDINCLPEKLSLALKVVEEMLNDRIFDQEIFEREKNFTLQNLESKNRKVFAPTLKAFATMLYGEKHPYNCSASGSIEGVSAVTIEDMQDCLARIFRRDKIVVSVAGNIDVTKTSQLVDKTCASFSWYNGDVIYPAEPIFALEPEQKIIDLKREQSLVIIGVPGCNVYSNERYVVDLLLASLNGQSSRIFKVIREDHALSYDTGAIARFGHHRGYLALYALTDPEKACEAKMFLEKELVFLSKDGLSEEEFNLAKLQIISEKAFESQESRGIAINSGINEYYGLGHDSFFKELDYIKSMD